MINSAFLSFIFNLLLFPSVGKHIILSQNREDNCVCKKGIRSVGEGVSHSYFLLHIIFFIPKKRKKHKNKIVVLQARYSQGENFAPKAGMAFSSKKN